MVIHDMRNPTSCIKSGLEETSKNLSNILIACSDNDLFESKIESLIKIINETEEERLDDEN